ncbi:hypothetical protein HYC85_027808 [Camellia sinensis]|uniref:Uncharacterized protein n=1 Tax=Camellia sinensis TaxID=4442 RepID=A0A7J7FU51_CAMSI|nr:hypothetical protein HYC85_027808 [Camellia sinensis]
MFSGAAPGLGQTDPVSMGPQFGPPFHVNLRRWGRGSRSSSASALYGDCAQSSRFDLCRWASGSSSTPLPFIGSRNQKRLPWAPALSSRDHEL